MSSETETKIPHEVTDLLNKIRDIHDNIYRNQTTIENLRLEIKKIKKELYVICKHEWFIDHTEPFDSICKRTCKYCNLCANPHCN